MGSMHPVDKDFDFTTQFDLEGLDDLLPYQGQATVTGSRAQQSAYSRLDNIHNCWKIILRDRSGLQADPALQDRLHLAPLPLRSHQLRVLDVGSGTGIWAVEMARKCPNVTVVGVEEAEIPLSAEYPRNLHFEVCPIEAEWPFVKKYGLFDFVHMRTLAGSTKDWPGLLKKVMDSMDYGSIVELQEGYLTGATSADNSFEGTAIQKYYNLLSQAGERIGIPTNVPPQLAKMVRDAGFLDVVENRENCPIGPWVARELDTQGTGDLLRELGNFAREATISGAREYGFRALKILGWKDARARALINEAIADLNNPNIHLFYHTFVVHARKPYPSEV